MISPRGVIAPTHFVYDHDVLLFCHGTNNNVFLIAQILNHYGTILG